MMEWQPWAEAWMEDILTLDSERRMWGSGRSGLLRGREMFNIWKRMKLKEFCVEDALVVILVLTPTALFATQLWPENYGQTDASVNTGRLADNLTLWTWDLTSLFRRRQGLGDEGKE